MTAPTATPAIARAPRYDAAALVACADALLVAAGMRADIARDVAEVLVDADLMGHTTHGLQLLGSWNGSAVSFDVAPAPAGYKTAVLVQAPNGGPILGATTD